jgi:hypothetical protein
MVAGADSIDDMGLLRHGAMGRVCSSRNTLCLHQQAGAAGSRRTTPDCHRLLT